MSFFGKIRDALFGSTPEVKPADPAPPSDTASAPAPAAEAKGPAPQRASGSDAAIDEAQDRALRDAARQQEAPPSSADPRRGAASPATELYAAALELRQGPGKDLSSEEFIKLGEATSKALQGDHQVLEKLVVEHDEKITAINAELEIELEAEVADLLPNLERVTWDKLMKLTGFNMKNPPIGDRSPEALARVRKELKLFIRHSDRFTLGPKVERDKKAGEHYKRVDAIASKIAYLTEIAERFRSGQKSITKQIADIRRHIEYARAHPRQRVTQQQAEEKLGRQVMHRRREQAAIMRRAYDVCAAYKRYEQSPAYSQLPWFWWYVFTGAQYDRSFRPKEVEDYIREHPEYKPPVPRPPRPPEEPPPEEPWPNPEPWPVPWPYPEPWPWPEPWPEPPIPPRPPES